MNNFLAFNIAIGDKNEEMEFIISSKSNWSKIRMNNEKINFFVLRVKMQNNSK